MNALLQRSLILLAALGVGLALASFAGAGLTVKPLPCRFTLACDQVIGGTLTRSHTPILDQILVRRVLMYDWLGDRDPARRGTALRRHRHGLPHTSPWVI